jgi:inosine-uridine nucleoside N-ribohydrolase
MPGLKANPEPYFVLMDCDPGWDDALALTLLIGKWTPNLTLGVTTVFGNEELKDTTINAQRLTALWNKPIEVYAGAATGISQPVGTRPKPAQPCHPLMGLSRLGRLGKDNAVDVIISAAKLYGANLAILATGPVTNIARAILASPEDMKKVGALFVVGGSFSNDPTDEFNFRMDPKAANIVVQAGLNTLLFPFKVLQKVASKSLLGSLSGKGDIADFCTAIIADQLAQRNEVAGMGIYDAMAALCVLQPGLFWTTRDPQRIRIEAAEGTIVPEGDDGTAIIVDSVDADGARDLFVSRVSG